MDTKFCFDSYSEIPTSNEEKENMFFFEFVFLLNSERSFMDAALRSRKCFLSSE